MGDAGMDCGHTQFRRQRRQYLGRVTAAQDKRGVVPRQAGGQCGQAVMQPPAAGAADRPGLAVIQDIDGQDTRPAGQGGGKRRVVGQAEILAEPEYVGVGHQADLCGRAAAASFGAGGLGAGTSKVNRRVCPSRNAWPPRGKCWVMAGAMMSSPPV